MTALSAGLALVPLLFGAGEPGREILHPVAVTIFGGLVSSTLLDTLLTPVLFLRFGAKPLERILAAREACAGPCRAHAPQRSSEVHAWEANRKEYPCYANSHSSSLPAACSQPRDTCSRTEGSQRRPPGGHGIAQDGARREPQPI